MTFQCLNCWRLCGAVLLVLGWVTAVEFGQSAEAQTGDPAEALFNRRRGKRA